MEDKKNNQKGTAIDWDELHMELERRKRAEERRKKEALARGVEPWTLEEARKYYWSDDLASTEERVLIHLAGFEDDYYSSGFMTIREWARAREKYDVYKDSTGHD